jgi:hypothetical protein
VIHIPKTPFDYLASRNANSKLQWDCKCQSLPLSAIHIPKASLSHFASRKSSFQLSDGELVWEVVFSKNCITGVLKQNLIRNTKKTNRSRTQTRVQTEMNFEANAGHQLARASWPHRVTVGLE